MSNNLLKAKINFLQAAKILFAQQVDQELESPQVRIEPQETLVEKAVEKIKKLDPNYFKGVRSVVSGSMSGYGEVRSGPTEDPAVIHLNFQRIKNEVTSKNPGASKEQIDEAIINAIVETIAHEKGHIKGYKPETGFTPESGAEQEAKEIITKIQ